MINIGDAHAYGRAIGLLAEFKRRAGGRCYKGRFVQIFLGLKFFQPFIPTIHSGTFITSEVLQSLLDDLYSKVSRPLNECVLSIFEANHLARTGVVPPGATSSSNIWRNNLHLQKGIGCYATPNELDSRTFLDEPREDCRHLIGDLEGGRCELCPTGARYRRESHRKWLRIDPGGNGFAVVDLMNISNFAPYVAPKRERIPVVPLIYALYYDGNPGLAVGSRPTVSVEDFCLDFNMAESEFEAYFDQSPTNPFNAPLLSEFPSLAFRPSPRAASRDTSGGGVLTKPRTRLGSRSAATAIPAPVLTGTIAPPPRSHNGWEAEQHVFSALHDAGWEVHDVRRQRVGYDLLAKKGRRTIYVEVKSSVGYCAPDFTSREWQQAAAHGANYVVAIIESFNPGGSNMIYWVTDPVRNCIQTETRTVSHCVSRSSWMAVARQLIDL